MPHTDQTVRPLVRPLAIVTGASSGIGLELARQLADRGSDLVLVADEESVEEVAEELRATDRDVRAVRADLTRAEDVERAAEVVRELGRPVDVLVLNAGVTVSGAVDRTPLEDELRLVDLNCRSTVHLAKLLLPEMVERGRGRVLVTSSVAGSPPNPYQASYGASKAFLRSWAQAVRHELSGTGVSVTTLMPGPTDTAIFEGGPIESTRIAQGRKDRAADVARDALHALDAGRAAVVTGPWHNRLQVLVGDVVPDRLAAAATSVMTRPRRA